MEPVKTFFDKTVAMKNPLFPAEYLNFGRGIGLTSWRGAARKYAALFGGALVFRNNGDLLVYSRRNGKIVQRTYPQKKWGWDVE